MLRDAFFQPSGSSKSFSLRFKGATQDDPLDEFIAKMLSHQLRDATCQKPPGGNTNPEIVVYRNNACEGALREILKSDTSGIVTVEVKKLARGRSGRIARSTGLDHNTTPACGTVRIYDAEDKGLDIRGFYLFVCQEPVENGNHILTALALCDGNILNEDFELYLSIVGPREKEVGLGTYGDGVNRNRPMFVFSNPLGAEQLDHSCTLVTKDELSNVDPRIGLVYRIYRSTTSGE